MDLFYHREKGAKQKVKKIIDQKQFRVVLSAALRRKVEQYCK